MVRQAKAGTFAAPIILEADQGALAPLALPFVNLCCTIFA